MTKHFTLPRQKVLDSNADPVAADWGDKGRKLGQRLLLTHSSHFRINYSWMFASSPKCAKSALQRFNIMVLPYTCQNGYKLKSNKS